jgi:thioredoxin
MLEVKKFSALWCGPCKTLGPIMDKVMPEYSDVIYTKVDIDEDKNNGGEEIGKYGVRSVPTVILLKDGEVVDKFVGMKSESDIREFLDNNKN